MVPFCLFLTVMVVHSQPLDLSNWMQIKSHILLNLTLSELTILGTHDSGAYNLTRVQIPTYEPEYLEVLVYVAEQLGIPLQELITMWGKAQPSNLYDQMMNGVRFIDLRCGYLDVTHEWVTFHWEAGLPIQALVNDVARFLNEHPKEIVLIEASHFDGYNINEEKLNVLVDIFERTFGNGSNIGLFPRIDPATNGYPTYGEMISKAARVFLSFGNDTLVSKYDNLQYKEVFENSYADSSNITYMMQWNDKQVQRFNNNETNASSLFKISWTLTPDEEAIKGTLIPGRPHDLLELAEVADNKMWNWTQSKFKEKLRIGNVFIFDNYPKAATQQILNALY